MQKKTVLSEQTNQRRSALSAFILSSKLEKVPMGCYNQPTRGDYLCKAFWALE